jgi:hypothetical protein
MDFVSMAQARYGAAPTPADPKRSLPGFAFTCAATFLKIVDRQFLVDDQHQRLLDGQCNRLEIGKGSCKAEI